MYNNRFKRSGKCRTCRRSLASGYKSLGFCGQCAIKETMKLKKRIKKSAIIGACAMLIVFAGIYYIGAAAFMSDTRGYEGDIFIPTFFGYFAINSRAFNAITTLSFSAKIILGLVCFLAPFGAYIRLQPNTYRHTAENQLYRQDPLVGGMIAGYENHRLEGIGFFILELFVSALSGPVLFFYRPYKLRQLSQYKYLQKAEEDNS